MESDTEHGEQNNRSKQCLRQIFQHKTGLKIRIVQTQHAHKQTQFKIRDKKEQRAKGV